MPLAQSRGLGLGARLTGSLPFGRLIDQWRWKVFSGEVTPDHYNEAWWELRRRYQGVAPPVPRFWTNSEPVSRPIASLDYRAPSLSRRPG